MRCLVLIAVVVAMAAARPETYKEKEDFQYSRSSSDDGSKSGYYGAQRGNMGGNYERAHNMDPLAQHQMSGLVHQVDGELGDASNTKTGSVFTASNSRGIYGSGHYDLNNLEGRNFQEGTSYGNSHSQSALTDSAYRDHSSNENRYRNSKSYSHSSRNSNSERSEYEQQAGIQSSNLRSGDSTYQQEFGAYDGSSRIGHSSSPYQNRLVSTRPMKILVRPGTRVIIPIATETFDADHSASSYDSLVHNQHAAKSDASFHDSSVYNQHAVKSDASSYDSSIYNQHAAKSDAEVIANSDQESHNQQVPANKHYESSYSYRKEWEKHGSSPGAVPLGIDDHPIPKTSELYDDALQTAHNSRNQQYTSNMAVGSHQNSHSSNLYNTKTNLASSSHSRQQSEYDIQREKLASDLNAFTSNAHQSNFDADVANQQGTANSKPKSYQSSYSYHKSWERQGDPYVIVPVPDAQNGQASQRLISSNSHNGYSSHQHGSNHKSSRQSYSSNNGLMDCDCDEEGHIRVARSYNMDQEVQQQQNGWDLDLQHSQNQWDEIQDLGQQTQNKWESPEDLVQQAQNQWDKLEDLGQQTQNQWDKLEDPRQQTQNKWDNPEDLGQQTQNQWDKVEGRIDDLGQQTHHRDKIEDLGQESQDKLDKIEDVKQQTQNKFDKIEDLGQQSQSKWDKIEDVGQQTQNNFEKIEEFEQPSQNKQNKIEDLGQQSQSQWDKIEDLGQHTQNKWDESVNVEQQSQNQWDKFEAFSQHHWGNQNILNQQSQSSVNQGQATWRYKEQSHKTSDTNHESQEASSQHFYQHENKDFLDILHRDNSLFKTNSNTNSDGETHNSDKQLDNEQSVLQNNYSQQQASENTFRDARTQHSSSINNLWDKLDRLDGESSLHNFYSTNKYDSFDIEHEPSHKKEITTTEKSKDSNKHAGHPNDIGRGDIETDDINFDLNSNFKTNDTDSKEHMSTPIEALSLSTNQNNKTHTSHDSFNKKQTDISVDLSNIYSNTNKYNDHINSDKKNHQESAYHDIILHDHQNNQHDINKITDQEDFDKPEEIYNEQHLDYSKNNENVELQTLHHHFDSINQQNDNLDQQNMQHSNQYFNEHNENKKLYDYGLFSGKYDQENFQYSNQQNTHQNNGQVNLENFDKSTLDQQQFEQGLAIFEQENMEQYLQDFDKSKENFEQKTSNEQPLDFSKLNENLDQQSVNHQFETFNQQNENLQQNSQVFDKSTNDNFDQENLNQDLVDFSNLDGINDQQTINKHYDSFNQESENMELYMQNHVFDQHNAKQNLNEKPNEKIEVGIPRESFDQQQHNPEPNFAQEINISSQNAKQSNSEHSVTNIYQDKKNDTNEYISQQSPLTTAKPESEKPGFWASVGNKFSKAKDKVTSWFQKTSE